MSYIELFFLLGVCLKLPWAALVIPMYLDLSAVVIGAVRKLIHRKRKETRDGDAKVSQSSLAVFEQQHLDAWCVGCPHPAVRVVRSQRTEYVNLGSYW